MRMFFCAGCRTEYATHTSDEERNREFEEQYGHSVEESDEEIFSVCDACYEKIVAHRQDS